MDRDKIETVLKEHGLLKYEYRGIAKALSKIMNCNESIKVIFLTDGGYWILMSRRIIIVSSGFLGHGVSVDEVINHSQIERLYYNINKGFFSSSMELKIKLKKEKTRTYKVNSSYNFDYVAKAIDNLKYAKSRRKKRKS